MTTEFALRAFRRVHSPIVFAGIVIAFFLPFATVSCGEAETTFTGIQLVTRTVPEGGVIDPADLTQGEISDRVERESSALAAVILFLATLGWVLGVLGVERGPGWVACLGTVLTIMLSEQAWNTSFGGPDIQLQAGYELALSLFAWVWIVHVVRAIRRSRAEAHPVARGFS